MTPMRSVVNAGPAAADIAVEGTPMDNVGAARRRLLFPQFWFDKSTPAPPPEPALTQGQRANFEILTAELDRQKEELARHPPEKPAPPGEHASGQVQEMNRHPPESELLTMRQRFAIFEGAADAIDVARILGRPVRTIRGWARQGRIPCKKTNGCWIFDPAEIADWCDGQATRLVKKPAASSRQLPGKKFVTVAVK
jgi:hypothetical protein